MDGKAVHLGAIHEDCASPLQQHQHYDVVHQVLHGRGHQLAKHEEHLHGAPVTPAPVVAAVEGHHGHVSEPWTIKEPHGFFAAAFDTLLKQRDRDQFCDVILTSQGHRFPAHRCVLAVSSDYWFTSPRRYKEREEIEVKCQNLEALADILNYCYTGQIAIHRNSVMELFYLSHHYQMSKLKSYCCDFLGRHLNMHNVSSVAEMATQYEAPDLLDASLHFLQSHLAQPEALGFPAIVVQQLAEQMHNVPPAQDLVLQFISDWVADCPGERHYSLTPLLRSINWEKLSADYICDFIDRHPLYQTSPAALSHILNLVMDRHGIFLGPRFQDLQQSLQEKDQGLDELNDSTSFLSMAIESTIKHLEVDTDWFLGNETAGQSSDQPYLNVAEQTTSSSMPVQPNLSDPDRLETYKESCDFEIVEQVINEQRMSEENSKKYRDFSSSSKRYDPKFRALTRVFRQMDSTEELSVDPQQYVLELSGAGPSRAAAGRGTGGGKLMAGLSDLDCAAGMVRMNNSSKRSPPTAQPFEEERLCASPGMTLEAAEAILPYYAETPRSDVAGRDLIGFLPKRSWPPEQPIQSQPLTAVEQELFVELPGDVVGHLAETPIRVAPKKHLVRSGSQQQQEEAQQDAEPQQQQQQPHDGEPQPPAAQREDVELKAGDVVEETTVHKEHVRKAKLLAEHRSMKSSTQNESTSSTSKVKCTFRCGECPFTTSGENRLKVHMKQHKRSGSVADKKGLLACPLCDFASPTSRRLKLHLRQSHSNEDPPFRCGKCDFSCSKPARLASHLAHHADVDSTVSAAVSVAAAPTERPRRFACAECPKRFPTRHALGVHAVSHTTNRAFCCATCNFATKYKTHLLLHLRVHGGNVLKCDVEGCTFAAIKLSHLEAHRRTHTGEKPFECATCQRCFVEKSQLRRHERTHSEELPFACPRCKFRTKRRDKLKCHMLRLHEMTSASWPQDIKNTGGKIADE